MKVLAFLVLSCLGLAAASSGAVDAPIAFELYQDGAFVETLYPPSQPPSPGQGPVISSRNYDHCKQPVLIMVDMGNPLTGTFGRNNSIARTVATQLSNNSDYNIIVVEYNNSYFLAAGEAAAHQVVDFLDLLTTTYNFGGEDVIITANGLGAQVAGYISKIFRVGKIFAFDPIGYGFDDLPTYLRLTKSDADLVVVIHTSDLMGSRYNKMGDVNLIVDNGYWPKACVDTNLFCPHIFAQMMFIDSAFICNYKFTQCPSYAGFLRGRCAGNPQVALRYDMSYFDISIPVDGSTFYYATPDGAQLRPPICAPQDMAPVNYRSVDLCAPGKGNGYGGY